MADGLHITALVVSTWRGSDLAETRTEGDALSVDAVLAAVRALDGDTRNDLHLESDGAAAMVVAGGPELCFVYATYDNEAFLVPESRRHGAPVELMAGGQLGTFPADTVVDKESAAGLAATWARTGALDERFRWRES